MEMMFFGAVAFLAFANGTNDNFKGMATLWGSGTLSYRTALILANVMTFLGAVVALAIGGALIKTFSGKGIIAPETLHNPDFALAFAVGAGLCVFLATLARFPISTTHAILGALTGVGVFFSGADVNFTVLIDKGFVPLAVSPLLAITLTWLLWQMRWVFVKFPVRRLQSLSAAAVQRFNVQDCAHVISGSVVCMARGINDTPKIASIFLVGSVVIRDNSMLFISIGLLMILGSLLLSRKVAHVLSHEITGMSPVEGLGGNLVTAGLVLSASLFGFGVSTTHVSVGALIGISIMNARAHKRKIIEVLLAWLLTLPIAFALAYTAAFLITNA